MRSTEQVQGSRLPGPLPDDVPPPAGSETGLFEEINRYLESKGLRTE